MPSNSPKKTFELGDRGKVNRLGFGAMRLTGERIIGSPADEERAKAVLRRAVEHGIDFIDTADSYGPGVSERLIREELHPYSGLVVATKGGLLRNRAGDWTPCGDPAYLRDAVLCSLDRLGVDSIDLYQFHRPDPDVSFESSVRTLAELKDDGVIDQLGLSNVTVQQLQTAREITDIVTVQNQYNIATRESEDVLKACEEAGIGFIPWAPLGGGGAFDESVIDAVADAHDATPRQIALAWLLHHSPVMLPIPGTSSVEHFEENVAAREIELTNEEMSRLSE